MQLHPSSRCSVRDLVADLLARLLLVHGASLIGVFLLLVGAELDAELLADEGDGLVERILLLAGGRRVRGAGGLVVHVCGCGDWGCIWLRSVRFVLETCQRRHKRCVVSSSFTYYFLTIGVDLAGCVSLIALVINNDKNAR